MLYPKSQKNIHECIGSCLTQDVPSSHWAMSLWQQNTDIKSNKRYKIKLFTTLCEQSSIAGTFLCSYYVCVIRVSYSITICWAGHQSPSHENENPALKNGWFLSSTVVLHRHVVSLGFVLPIYQHTDFSMLVTDG